MIKISVESLAMKVPFQFKFKLTASMFGEVQSTELLDHQGRMTPINRCFSFKRRIPQRELQCCIQVYQQINKQDRLCGTVHLNRDDLNTEGKHVKKIKECPDTDAVIILNVSIESGMLDQSTDCQLPDSETSLKPIIEMLANKLYKQEKKKSTMIQHRQIEKFQGRYKKLVGNLDKQLKQVRQSSQHKIKTLELDLKDTVKLHNRQMSKITDQILYYKKKQQDKNHNYSQTEIHETSEISIEASPDIADQQIQTRDVDFAPQPIIFISELQQTDNPSIEQRSSKLLIKTQAFGCQMDETYLQMQEQIQTLRSQLQDEKEKCSALIGQITEINQQLAILQTYKDNGQFEREVEQLKINTKIQMHEERIKYEQTIKLLQDRVKSYQKEMEEQQQDRIRDLEDNMAEEIERIKIELLEKSYINKQPKQTVDAEVDCQFLEDSRNKFLEDVFEDNSELATKLEQTTTNCFKQAALIEQLQTQLWSLSSSARQLEADNQKLSEELAILKHEHESFVELNQKMYEDREAMLKTISKYEQQGKELYSFTKNFGKKVESKEDTILQKSCQKERSMISRRSRNLNPNKRLSQMRIQAGNQQLNLPKQDPFRGNILEIPELELQRKNSAQSSDYAAHQFLEIPSHSLRQDCIDDPDEMNQSPPEDEDELLINSVFDSASVQSANPTAQVKQSLVALYREIEGQAQQIENLNFELDLQQEKIRAYQATIATFEIEKEQVKSAYQGIVDDLRKDLQFVNEEKQALNVHCNQIERQRESLKIQFKQQLEQLIRQHCQKQNATLYEHAQVIEGFKQELDLMITQMSKTNEAANEQKHTLQRKIQALEETIEYINEQLDHRDQEIDQRNDDYLSQLENTCRQVEQIQQILSDRQKQCSELIEQMTEMQLRLADMQTREKGYLEMVNQRDLRIQQFLKNQSNSTESDVQKEDIETQTEKEVQVAIRSRRYSVGTRANFDQPPRKRKVSQHNSIQQLPLSIHQSDQISNILGDGIQQSTHHHIPPNPHFKDERIQQLEQKTAQLQQIVRQLTIERDEILTQTHTTIQYYEQQLDVLKQMLSAVQNQLHVNSKQFEHYLQQKNHEIEQLKVGASDRQQHLQGEFQSKISDLTKEFHQKLKALEQNIVNGTVKTLKLQHQLASLKSTNNSLNQSHKKLQIQHDNLKAQNINLKRLVEEYETKYRYEINQREQKVGRIIEVIQDQFKKQLQFQKDFMIVQNKINFGTPIATHRMLHQDDTNTSEQAIIREIGESKKIQAETQADQPNLARDSNIKRLEQMLRLKDQQLKSILQELHDMKIEQQASKRLIRQSSNMYKKRITKLMNENFKYRANSDKQRIESQKQLIQQEIIHEVVTQDISRN